MDGPVLVVYEESRPSSWNPLFARSMVDARIDDLVYDRLFLVGPDGAVEAPLLDRWEVTGASVRVVPKAGISWHDGEPFGAKDVCFTVRAILDEGTPTPVRNHVRATGCKVDGDAAVIDVEEGVDPVRDLGFYVLPAHLWKGTVVTPDDAAAPIGTGPYRVVRRRRDEWTMQALERHHAPQIASITTFVGGDEYISLRGLVDGKVDGAWGVALPRGFREPDFPPTVTQVAPRLFHWFIAVKTDGSLANPRLREALDLGINRRELAQICFPEEVDLDVSEAPPADLDRARGLLAEVGGAPAKLKIGMEEVLHTQSSDLLNQVGNDVQAIGFDREVFLITEDDWTRQVVVSESNDYDLLVGRWMLPDEEAMHLPLARNHEFLWLWWTGYDVLWSNRVHGAMAPGHPYAWIDTWTLDPR